MKFNDYLNEVTANDWEPLGQEAKANIGSKISDGGHSGYAADMAKGQKAYDAQRERDIKEYGGRGNDERHDLDRQRVDTRKVYKFAFIPKDAKEQLGTTVARISGFSQKNNKVPPFGKDTPKFADVAVTVFNKDKFLELVPSGSNSLKIIRDAVEAAGFESGTRNGQIVNVRLPLAAMEQQGLIYPETIKINY